MHASSQSQAGELPQASKQHFLAARSHVQAVCGAAVGGRGQMWCEQRAAAELSTSRRLAPQPPPLLRLPPPPAPPLKICLLRGLSSCAHVEYSAPCRCASAAYALFVAASVEEGAFVVGSSPCTMTLVVGIDARIHCTSVSRGGAGGASLLYTLLMPGRRRRRRVGRRGACGAMRRRALACTLAVAPSHASSPSPTHLPMKMTTTRGSTAGASPPLVSRQPRCSTVEPGMPQGMALRPAITRSHVAGCMVVVVGYGRGGGERSARSARAWCTDACLPACMHAGPQPRRRWRGMPLTRPHFAIENAVRESP